MIKTKIGFFSLTSCAGCHLSVIFTEENLLYLFEKLDIEHFPMIGKHQKLNKKFDIAFVEGCVARKEEIKKIKQIRKNAKIVIALGSCATQGGVPAIKDLGYAAAPLETYQKEHLCFLESVDVYGIGYYVDVDYYLRGCPPEKYEIIEIIKNMIVGKKIPRNIDYPVCKECREKNNICLLQEGRLCIGPVTYGGCHAKCPSLGIECFGCRGPLDDANVDALVSLFKKHKISEADIKRMFTKFAATAKIARKKEKKNAQNN